MTSTIAPIAILGAGPAGLTLARLLRVANIPCTIFERDSSASQQGLRSNSGTLDIHANDGQLALKKGGLLDHFKAKARWNVPTRIADYQGNVLNTWQSSGDQDRPEIDRKDLRQLLLDSIDPATVNWSSKVDKISRCPSEHTMSIHLANGTITSGFKLVVGADGAWSKARAAVTSAKPQYSGVTYLTTTIRPSNPYHSLAEKLAGNGNYLSLGDGGKLLVCMKLSEGYYVAAGAHMHENFRDEFAHLLDAPDELRPWIVENYFQNWPEVHRNLILGSEGHFHVWPLYSLPEESLSWGNVPGTALVGDAAHLAVTNGEGVNVAMYDAYCLAEQIVKHGIHGLDTAVSEYEKEMFVRGKESIRGGLQWIQIGHGPDSPHGLLKAFGGEEEHSGWNEGQDRGQTAVA